MQPTALAFNLLPSIQSTSLHCIHLTTYNPLPSPCSQCGRFHDLKVFWGTQRSCRDSLLRHQQRRQRRLGQLSAVPAAPAAPAAEATMEHPHDHCRPAKQHKQLQTTSEAHSAQAGELPPLPTSSSSGQSASASAAVSLPAAMPAQQLLPPWSPAGPPLPAARAAAFARVAALASQQPEIWEPVAPLTPAVRPERPDSKAQPLPAATPMPSPAAAAVAAAAVAAAATPMPTTSEQQLDAAWPPVRLAAPVPAATAHWPPQQAPQCTCRLPQAACPQPQHPSQQQPLGCAIWLPPQQPGLQHAQPRHPQQLPPLPETACWPPRHAEQPQPQHPGLPCWAHCSSSGCSSGRSGSPCLPHFDTKEIEALVEILHPPSLESPIPELLAEALACAAGTVPCRAAGAAAPAMPPTLSAVPAGLCGAAPCDSPAVHLQVPPAPSPLPSAAAAAERWAGDASEWQHQHQVGGWAGGPAAWQQLWKAAAQDSEQRAALAFAAMRLPLAHGTPPAAPQHAASPAPQAEADLQAACWEWPEELFGIPPLPCLPSPAMSWMA